jgi:ligand-binding sensor domain-containing protein/serine phosphatase RsbU (regulator of sigma subunit)
VRIYLYIISFLCLTALSGFGQKINLQKFSVKDGLCQSTVKQIEQDNYGNLWLATNYGLSKFNGKTFENYTTSNGLPSNDISCLLFTNEHLFIGTRKGLCVFNGNKIENTDLFQKINGNVKKILEREKVLHIITTKGYYQLDIGKNSYKLDSIAIPNITSQNPTDAEFDTDGNLWVSTNKKGLFFLELSISTRVPKLVLIQNSVASTTINKKLVRVVNFNSDNILRGNAISCIEFDKQHNLLLSDWSNGIAQIKFDTRLSDGFFEAKYINLDSTVTGSINVDRFTCIYRDSEDNVYLASDGFGYIQIPLDKNTNELDFLKNDLVWINNAQGFYGNNPLCFKVDNNNNTWIGTLNDGLVLLNDKSSLSYNQKLGLDEEKVISLYKSSDSALWLGTYGGGAFRFKNRKFTRSFWEQGISESIIKSIAEDNFENIWLGTTGGGVSIISKDNVTKELLVSKVISETNNLVSNYVSFIYKARNGAMWVGYQSQNKIDRIIINKDFTYNVTTFIITDLTNFNVTCMLEDDAENIWITSNEGIWILNPKTERVNNEYAMFKNVQTVSKDWNGNMWIGTSDVGSIILKNKLKARYFENASANSFEKITIQNGISSNCINTILFEKDVIWFITNNGINEITFDAYLNKIKEIKNWNKSNGFASYDNKPNASVFDNQQNIWIGSIEGLTLYQNKKGEENVVSKKGINIFINAIRIENKSVDWTDEALFKSGDFTGLKFDGFFNWYKIPKNLQLDYTHNTIQLVVSTDNIAEQKQINYAHKLIGYDKDWITLFNTNEITYRNLPSGDYSLVIKASLGNDFENAKEFTYNFSVKPPFWKATWFYVFVILIVIGLLYYLITNREKRLKREKLKLELLVKSRTSEIEKKKREIEIQSTLIQGINKDLTDSIKYAQRIQQTILPNEGVLKKYFGEHFIYYKPRNIVSGDYYWIKEANNCIYVAVVDCTGHGVPGAFMSLISSSILNESIEDQSNQCNPAKMVEYLRKEISLRLNQNSTELVNDGLDIALICFDKHNSTIEYVNANRPLYIISNDELITLASENVSIGGYADLDAVIPSKKITVKQDDQLFMFTDGVTDQFGGERNKKYNPQRLRQFLLMNNYLPLNALHNKLSAEIADWQGNLEQTDDVLLIGIKI